MHSCVKASVHYPNQGIDPVAYLISYLFENVYDGRSQIEWASHYYSKENSLSKDLISWPGRAIALAW